ncbi:hypothetical protein GJAV_G00274740 [Gymnothorax javanicus]|nr:hypothetical protein GJAV_G00274740 [Gymnothorax javanicus]
MKSVEMIKPLSSILVYPHVHVLMDFQGFGRNFNGILCHKPINQRIENSLLTIEKKHCIERRWQESDSNFQSNLGNVDLDLWRQLICKAGTERRLSSCPPTEKKISSQSAPVSRPRRATEGGNPSSSQPIMSG